MDSGWIQAFDQVMLIRRMGFAAMKANRELRSSGFYKNISGDFTENLIEVHIAVKQVFQKYCPEKAWV